MTSENEIDEAVAWAFGHRPALEEDAAVGAAVPAAEFRAVGLSEADADDASRGLAEGRYFSFEDACLAVTIFGPSSGTRLDEAAMRNTARRLAEAATPRVPGTATFENGKRVDS